MALLVGALAPSSARAAPGHALLIGASQPQHGPALPGAAADVEAMRAALVADLGVADGQVHTLVGASATVAAVTDALADLAEASAGSAALVYFAGAGARLADDNLDEPDPWDEAWALADGLLTDDDLATSLAAVVAEVDQLALVIDASPRPSSPLARHRARFVDTGPGAGVAVPWADLGGGDGRAHWGIGVPSDRVVVLQAAVRGVAVEVDGGGGFTAALVAALPHAATYADWLAIATAPASVDGAVPGGTGALDLALFGRTDPPAPLGTTLDLPVASVSVRLRTGQTPADLTEASVAALTEAGSKVADQVVFADDGDFTVARDPTRPIETLQILGPQGKVRNVLSASGSLSAEERIIAALRGHARHKALLALPAAPGPLSVQMVPTDSQGPCARGSWPEVPPNTEQIVPVCHRWQLTVALGAEAQGPVEVGGVILANDGGIYGFPRDRVTVSLDPGQRHTFPLAAPGRPAGLRSVPPLGITEHILVFGAPEGSHLDYGALTEAAPRAIGTAPASGGAPLMRAHLPFRVVANPTERSEALSTDPDVRRRELTLNGYDISPLLPANPDSYLYKVLQNAEALAEFHRTDGLAYAQCLPAGSSSINNTSRFSEADWPGDTCWSDPWSFEADAGELSQGPGIDCSTSMWFVFTRACRGRIDLAIPDRQRREKNADYQARIRDWHQNERGCLLLTDEDWRAGYASTSMMTDADIMGRHWSDCMGQELRTGDLLVTRNQRDTSGHTYLVIDPDRFVVFGSHGSDLSWDRLTDEERAAWAEYEEANQGALDAGVEYQFLAWSGKDALADTELGKWGGFATQRLKACWRHHGIAAEWDADPSSRPSTRDLASACQPEVCR